MKLRMKHNWWIHVLFVFCVGVIIFIGRFAAIIVENTDITLDFDEDNLVFHEFSNQTFGYSLNVAGIVDLSISSCGDLNIDYGIFDKKAIEEGIPALEFGCANNVTKVTATKHVEGTFTIPNINGDYTFTAVSNGQYASISVNAFQEPFGSVLKATIVQQKTFIYFILGLMILVAMFNAQIRKK